MMNQPYKPIKLAIVGAPNVGKSTLFNRLIGGRRSIVQDEPGVTRDRIYAEIDLCRWLSDIPEGRFIIIDTGGMFYKDDSLYTGVQRQAEAAVAECDAVLFMTDGRVGPTAADRLISKVLRNAGKPVILTVNKLDSLDLVPMAGEFYNLSLGEPLPFSAAGRVFKPTLRDLYNRLCIIFPKLLHIDSDTEDAPRLEPPAGNLIKLAIVGKPNVGKSSILNRIVGFERALVHNEAGTTRDALDTIHRHDECDYLLIDTAGLRRKSKVTLDLERYAVDRAIKAIVRSEVVALVIDVSEDISHQEERLAALIRSRGRGCMIVLNKWDTIEKNDDTYRLYEAKLKGALPFISYAPVVITSAVTGQRITHILDTANVIRGNLFKRIRTNVFNRTLQEILTISDPARAGAHNLKIYYGTQVGVNPPTFALFVNNPKLVGERFLRFLERKLQQEFNLVGVPICWSIKKSQSQQESLEKVQPNRQHR